MFNELKRWAKRLKQDVSALYLAARDARTPVLAKCVAVAVVAYALSPIDLIPDFIPVLGYLDDVILVPLGVMLAVRLTPAELMAEFRAKAAAKNTLGKNWIAAGVIVALWVAAVALIGVWVW